MTTLPELIQQARLEGKFLFCHYQGLWFSPDELAKANAKGEFRWGPVNWRLRDPNERLQEIDATITALELERVQFKNRMSPAPLASAAGESA